MGKDGEGKDVPTLFEMAHKAGLKTGVATTCDIQDATPAAFVAHITDRNKWEDISEQYLDAPIDFAFGGGRKPFHDREDGLNLFDSLSARNTQVITTWEDLEKTSTDRVFALLAEREPLRAGEREENFLESGVMAAINHLKRSNEGFILMVEGSQIDHGGHFNNTSYINREMLDFDKVIGKVLDFAEADGETLVIVTADHKTGGYAIVDHDMAEGRVDGKFTTKNHSGEMVPVFSAGPGAEHFTGIIDNTDIHFGMVELLDIERSL